jgi:hypothetical protein
LRTSRACDVPIASTTCCTNTTPSASMLLIVASWRRSLFRAMNDLPPGPSSTAMVALPLWMIPFTATSANATPARPALGFTDDGPLVFLVTSKLTNGSRRPWSS